LPPTTLGATVEVFELASTRAVITGNYDTTLYQFRRDLIGNTTSNNVLDFCGCSCLAIGEIFFKYLEQSKKYKVIEDEKTRSVLK
jgi:hypothetical protein